VESLIVLDVRSAERTVQRFTADVRKCLERFQYAAGNPTFRAGFQRILPHLKESRDALDRLIAALEVSL
jgi:hypothetical protein